MGITGLLPLLKSIQQPIHVSEYKSKTLAIDGYSWLHKGVFSCSFELCTGIPTKRYSHPLIASFQRYINFFMGRIAMLKSHGVIPYVVFDGAALPGKEGTESGRKEFSLESCLISHLCYHCVENENLDSVKGCC